MQANQDVVDGCHATAALGRVHFCTMSVMKLNLRILSGFLSGVALLGPADRRGARARSRTR